MQNLLYRAEIFNVEPKVEFSTVLGVLSLSPHTPWALIVNSRERLTWGDFKPLVGSQL